jgi:hypothetical protein
VGSACYVTAGGRECLPSVVYWWKEWGYVMSPRESTEFTRPHLLLRHPCHNIIIYNIIERVDREFFACVNTTSCFVINVTILCFTSCETLIVIINISYLLMNKRILKHFYSAPRNERLLPELKAFIVLRSCLIKLI